MKLRTAFLSIIALVCLGAVAWATATTPVTVTVASSPSTAVACVPAGSFTLPVAVGAVICTAAVTPSGGSYSLSLSGADAALFAPSGMNVVVGSSPITVLRTYNFNVTSNP